jgi:uncharacterized protein (TIGR03067 family)
LPEPAASSFALAFKGDREELIAAVSEERPISQFKVDAESSPRKIDLELLNGENRGKLRYGIYELDKDVLKLCLPDGFASADRPKEFKTGEGKKDMLFVLGRLKRDLPADDTGSRKAPAFSAPHLFEVVTTDPAEAIYKYQGKRVTIKGEVVTAEGTRLSFTPSRALILLNASKDFTHGNDVVRVAFTATSDKPFSLRFLEFLDGLIDGADVAATGRCVITKQNGKFDLSIEDATISP